MDAQSLEAKILSDIPLTAQMGLRLVKFGAQTMEWEAPLSPNINHLGTGFGGSLFCASAVSCYSYVLKFLADRSLSTNNIVIAGAEIRYLRPVTSSFVARSTCKVPADIESCERFLAAQRKARLPLSAEIICEGQVCAEFSGKYVIVL